MAKSFLDGLFDTADDVMDLADRALPDEVADPPIDEERSSYRQSRNATLQPSSTAIVQPRYCVAGSKAPWHIVRLSDNLVIASCMTKDDAVEIAKAMNAYGT